MRPCAAAQLRPAALLCLAVPGCGLQLHRDAIACQRQMCWSPLWGTLPSSTQRHVLRCVQVPHVAGQLSTLFSRWASFPLGCCHVAVVAACRLVPVNAAMPLLHLFSCICPATHAATADNAAKMYGVLRHTPWAEHAKFVLVRCAARCHAVLRCAVLRRAVLRCAALWCAAAAGVTACL